MSLARQQQIRSWSDLPWGAIRLLIVIGGGLLVLQSSSQLDAPKLAYLAVAVIAFAGSLHSVLVGSARDLARAHSYLLVSVALLSAVLAGSFVVAAANGTPTINWVRDAVAYALFAAVPILALDAATSTSKRFLVGLLTVVGMLASLSWAVEWLQRRLIVDLPLDRLLLPASQVAVALYAFALAAAMRRQHQFAWSAVAGVVLGLFLVTGTRSSLVLLIIPLAMGLAVRPRQIGHTVRVVGIHLVVALAVFGATQVVLRASTADLPGPTLAPSGVAAPSDGAFVPPPPVPPDAVDRFLAVDSLLNDPSMRERVAQYVAAWELFLSSPLIGVGPGHAIEWTDVSGFPRDEFTADTPLVLPAKFGLLGTAAVVFVAFSYARVVARLARRSGWTAETLAVLGYGVVAIVGLPLGMPIEDKSFSFGLALLFALAMGEMHHSAMATLRPEQSRLPT